MRTRSLRSRDFGFGKVDYRRRSVMCARARVCVCGEETCEENNIRIVVVTGLQVCFALRGENFHIIFIAARLVLRCSSCNICAVTF